MMWYPDDKFQMSPCGNIVIPVGDYLVSIGIGSRHYHSRRNPGYNRPPSQCTSSTDCELIVYDKHGKRATAVVCLEAGISYGPQQEIMTDVPPEEFTKILGACIRLSK